MTLTRILNTGVCHVPLGMSTTWTMEMRVPLTPASSSSWREYSMDDVMVEDWSLRARRMRVNRTTSRVLTTTPPDPIRSTHPLASPDPKGRCDRHDRPVTGLLEWSWMPEKTRLAGKGRNRVVDSLVCTGRRYPRKHVVAISTTPITMLYRNRINHAMPV